MNIAHMGGLTKLVVHAGLAIPVNFNDLTADSSWALQDFQAGEPPLFIDQIRGAVELADAQHDALLLFSGADTREEAEPLSEGQGSFLVAEHLKWFDRPNVRLRASTEVFSLDSYQNVVYSICRFKECVGRYPEAVTVVGYAFKEERFDMHRAAIRFSKDRFLFCGPNNPPILVDALAGEAKARAQFKEDPHGTGNALASKRLARNPFHRQHGYAVSCPELADLLGYRGSEVYPGRLPWDV